MVFHPVWETIFNTMEFGKYPGEDVIRFIARNFYATPDRKKIKILEMGCGPGANVWYLAREGFNTFGVDGSEVAIKRAQKRLDMECPGWSGALSVGDFVKLDFADGTFDAVIDAAAITHNSFADSVKAYGEAYRVLKPGGKLLTRCFARGCWGDGTGKQFAPDAYDCSEGPLVNLGYVRFTAKESIPELLHAFTIEAIELNTRSYENMRHEAREWSIIARK